MRSSNAALSPQQVVRAGLCIGCGGCAADARRPDVGMDFDVLGQLKPRGPQDWRTAATAALARTCPFSPVARNEDEIAAERFPAAKTVDGRLGRVEACFVGHAAAGGFREAGSSGGLVTWTAAELLSRGLVDGVAHVSAVTDAGPGERLFRYGISRSVEALRAGAKSRYYPVDLSEVIGEIRARPGRYAVVGVPCFIKAIHLMGRQDPVLRERIAYTLGLFCGHMKSARMVESFALQMGEDPAAVAAIDFRHKDPDRPANLYTARIGLRDGRERRQDWLSFADGDWGAGFFQNPACNFCDDVSAETADVAFGDAWVEPYSSDGRGTNVVVVRAPQVLRLMREALADGRLALNEVDADFVAQTQAAGFRQRREGLSLRLAGRRLRLRPRKRVPAKAPRLTPRRWMVYRLRQAITATSSPAFVLARRLDAPGLYTRGAQWALAVYQAFAWGHGRLGKLLDRLEGKAA